MCWKLNTKFCVKLADYERKFAGPSVRAKCQEDRDANNVNTTLLRSSQL